MGTKSLAGRRAALVFGMSMALSIAGLGTASAASPTDGLLLIGTDAAYARLVGPIDACHGLELWVGYVRADGLKSPINDGKPRFHTDVDTILSVFENADVEGCGSESLQLAGGRGIDAGDQVLIVELTSASLDGFQLTIQGVEGESDVTATFTMNVDWSAAGSVYTQTSHDPGQYTAHRTVDATVDATISVDDVTGGGDLASALASLIGAGPVGLDQTEGQLTHYWEIQVKTPSL